MDNILKNTRRPLTLFKGLVPLAMSLVPLAPLAFAQNQPAGVVTSSEDVTKLFCGALAWMFWGLIVLGVAMVLVGGYMYATAAGDAERVNKATKTLTYAAIAMAVGIIAQGIPYLIASFFGPAASLGNVC